jgi:hypothetical protein
MLKTAVENKSTAKIYHRPLCPSHLICDSHYVYVSSPLAENAAQLMQLTTLSTIGFHRPACTYFPSGMKFVNPPIAMTDMSQPLVTNALKTAWPWAGFVPGLQLFSDAWASAIDHLATGTTH